MKLIYCLLFFAFFAITLAQLDAGDTGKFSHFTVGGFQRARWKDSGDINGWNVASSSWSGKGSAGFNPPNSVSDIRAVGTDGLLAVGSFTSVNGKKAIGIAYFNGTIWCGFPHLNLYKYTPIFNPTTSFPRNPATAFGSAFAIHNIGNDYYIFGGSNTAGTPNFNMVGTSARIGVAGIVKLVFANNNFTVDTNAFQYKMAPAGYVLSSDSVQNRQLGYPANNATAPRSNNYFRTTKFRVVIDGSTPVFFVKASGVSLRFWRQTYNGWVTVETAGTRIIDVANAITTFTINGPGIGGVTDFDFAPGSSTLFICGNFNATGSTVANEQYFNVASFAYTNAQTFNYAKTLNPTTEMLYSDGTFTNDGFQSIAVESASTFYVSGSQIFTYTDVGVTRRERRFYVYRVSSSAPTIVGGGPAGRFFNSGDNAGVQTNPIQKVYLNGNTIHAFGSFNLINYQFDAQSKSNSRFLQKSSGWAQFANNVWSTAFGGGLVVSGTSQNVVPTTVSATSSYVFFLCPNANQAFDMFTNGITGFDDRTHEKKYKGFGNQRFVNRGGFVASTTFPFGSDGSIRTVHFIKSQPDGVDDAVLVGGNFDWIDQGLYGSVAYLRVKQNAYTSVGGGLWVENDNVAFTGDIAPPPLLAGTVNDLEERSSVFYAGGTFSRNVNGECISNIARLNYKDANSIWVGLGSGCAGPVNDILADGSKIYVGGNFFACGRKQGTRYIAYFDEDKDEWHALNSGLNNIVYAMTKYAGRLYVAGQFTQVSNIRVGGANGIASWDGDDWAPVLSRCQDDCAVGRFEFPFVSQPDPVARTTQVVTSLRVLSGKLYAQGQTPGSGTRYLLQYTRGGFWRQLGVASAGGACQKQGCLATNRSDIIAINFNNAAQTGYNPGYQQYEVSDKVWEETYNGFDGTIIHIAGSSSLTFSVVLLLILSLFYILF